MATGQPFAFIRIPAFTAVLDPVPSHLRQRPTRRLITLITCDPAWTGTTG